MYFAVLCTIFRMCSLCVLCSVNVSSVGFFCRYLRWQRFPSDRIPTGKRLHSVWGLTPSPVRSIPSSLVSIWIRWRGWSQVCIANLPWNKMRYFIFLLVPPRRHEGLSYPENQWARRMFLRHTKLGPVIDKVSNRCFNVLSVRLGHWFYGYFHTEGLQLSDGLFFNCIFSSFLVIGWTEFDIRMPLL